MKLKVVKKMNCSSCRPIDDKNITAKAGRRSVVEAVFQNGAWRPQAAPRIEPSHDEAMFLTALRPQGSRPLGRVPNTRNILKVTKREPCRIELEMRIFINGSQFNQLNHRPFATDAHFKSMKKRIEAIFAKHFNPLICPCAHPENANSKNCSIKIVPIIRTGTMPTSGPDAWGLQTYWQINLSNNFAALIEYLTAHHPQAGGPVYADSYVTISATQMATVETIERVAGSGNAIQGVGSENVQTFIDYLIMHELAWILGVESGWAAANSPVGSITALFLDARRLATEFSIIEKCEIASKLAFCDEKACCPAGVQYVGGLARSAYDRSQVVGPQFPYYTEMTSRLRHLPLPTLPHPERRFVDDPYVEPPFMPEKYQ